jgi:hypothetical protein
VANQLQACYTATDVSLFQTSITSVLIHLTVCIEFAQEGCLQARGNCEANQWGSYHKYSSFLYVGKYPIDKNSITCK